MMRTIWMVMLTLLLGGCGYNDFQVKDEEVKAGWAEVLNQYQRRFDLIPNLVNTVKGYAQQEKDVLLGVTEARAKVGSIQATPKEPITTPPGERVPAAPTAPVSPTAPTSATSALSDRSADLAAALEAAAAQ